jgi:hypothetical protein
MADKLVDTSAFANQSIIEVAESDPSYQAGYGQGLFCEDILEPLPKRLNTSGEDVLNKGNSWIGQVLAAAAMVEAGQPKQAP